MPTMLCNHESLSGTYTPERRAIYSRFEKQVTEQISHISKADKLLETVTCFAIPPYFYRPDALPATQPTVSKH